MILTYCLRKFIQTCYFAFLMASILLVHWILQSAQICCTKVTPAPSPFYHWFTLFLSLTLGLGGGTRISEAGCLFLKFFLQEHKPMPVTLLFPSPFRSKWCRGCRVRAIFLLETPEKLYLPYKNGYQNFKPPSSLEVLEGFGQKNFWVSERVGKKEGRDKVG